MTSAARPLSIPHWFTTVVGASLALALAVFPPWGIVGWVRSVDDRLARIEEQQTASQQLGQALLKNHSERIERTERDVERLSDRVDRLEGRFATGASK